MLRSAKINIILHCKCVLSAVQLSLLCREHNLNSQSDVSNLLLGMYIGWWVGKIQGFDAEFVLYVSKNTHLTQSTQLLFGLLFSTVPLSSFLGFCRAELAGSGVQ